MAQVGVLVHIHDPPAAEVVAVAESAAKAIAAGESAAAAVGVVAGDAPLQLYS